MSDLGFANLFPFDIAGRKWLWNIIVHPFASPRCYVGPAHPGTVWHRAGRFQRKIKKHGIR